MVSIPRVITVDPTSTISRIVRSAIDLTERQIVQVDVPNAAEALEELKRGGYSLMVTALRLSPEMQGVELALRARQLTPDTPVIILADADDNDLDEETRAESPFVYMRRPVDAQQFMRVLLAGIDSKNIFAAFATPTQRPPVTANDMGPVPHLDAKAATVIVDKLLTDVGAMAIVLSSRAGTVLVERGAVGYLDRESLTRSLLPAVNTTIAMSDVVGAQPEALQFYDGDTYDIFVLSVGYHYFLSLIFDGQAGVRQFGAVTRFGRRGAEDLKALLGAGAWIIQPPTPSEEQARRKTGAHARVEVPVEETVEPLAVKAESWGDETPASPEPVLEEETAPIFEPIENLDLTIFDSLETLDPEAADDLFDPDKLAKIASENRRGRGPISYDEARELGIVP